LRLGLGDEKREGESAGGTATVVSAVAFVVSEADGVGECVGVLVVSVGELAGNIALDTVFECIVAVVVGCIVD
jgi:hypothetical protein